jgi:hypothetical protein
VRELFDLDEARGVLIWRPRADRLANWNARYAGRAAGTIDGKGYVQVNVDGRFYGAHRLIWMHAHGVDPAGLEIDHKNGDRVDNRPCNLRLATRGENMRNSTARGDWPKGVYLCKKDGKFRAQIKFKGHNRGLGVFATPEAAHEAYRREASRVFGAFACFERRELRSAGR